MNIEDFPNEILLLIFEAGQRSRPRYSDKGPPFEVCVTQVSRRWRQLALRTPHLWTWVEFRLLRNISFFKAHIYCIRSSDLPLHITIDTTGWKGLLRGESFSVIFMNHIKYLKALFDTLTTHAHRWASFALSLHHPKLMEIALKRLAPIPAAPNLRDLALAVRRLPMSNIPELVKIPTEHRPFHDNAPLLRHLTLEGVCLPWDSAHYIALSSLSLKNHPDRCRPNFQEFSRILSNSAELESLVISNAGPRASSATGEDPHVELPTVLDFTLQDLTFADATALMTHLTLPNLDTLTLRLFDQHGKSRYFNSDVQVRDFVRQLATPYKGTGRSLLQPVQALYLDHATSNDLPLAERLLSSLPNLRVLALNYSPDGHTLDLLGDRPGMRKPSDDPRAVRVLCPLLRILVVRLVSRGLLVHVLKHRKSIGFPFLRLALPHDVWPMPGQRTAIEELVKVELMEVPTPGTNRITHGPEFEVDLDPFLERSYVLADEEPDRIVEEEAAKTEVVEVEVTKVEVTQVETEVDK
ncbi:hypothetical protein OF83DRAFT_166350 [Amylostereum chailletii]|nr:hypothetical protein OF83DRAFT_166350 [Amylostereum chailletii]